MGVFSPSHRNHYLNVTSNNLLKIFPPEPEGSFSQREVREGMVLLALEGWGCRDPQGYYQGVRAAGTLKSNWGGGGRLGRDR